MCELLGLSSNVPSTVSLSLRKLAQHGGPPALIGDGWGVGYYEGLDVRLIKDAAPVDASDWIRFVEDHDLRSHIVMSHIRKATMGERSYRNTQPFTRELGGRVHLFAHNGWLPGIAGSASFDAVRFRAVGETDSERAFCALLDRMLAVWERHGGIPLLDARLSVVSSFAAELRTLGPANFLYSDGDTLFAHGDRRKNGSTGKVRPPGLVFLRRFCPRNGQSAMVEALSVEGADQYVTLVASVPLTDDRWESFAEGEVIAISNGEIVARRCPVKSVVVN
ncbi:class II glutamine amidotransferase [Mesorhizobium tianshanense]|uniref:Glutamine amidotransferase n=1 Tax=Mesorhizobium tianshanense TaxID=39844 RepID=A0A562MC57_9HYPH|nr:class II glutamine amidotransferase [Mesorhizobium tianshanense]TWI17470.1 glutamine amidotransferase [Mesorhizobium tianshanense]